MIHNIYAREKWDEFINSTFYIGKYRYYNESEVLILDGSKMQTSTEFIYEIFLLTSSRKSNEIYDYRKQKLPNKSIYGWDSISDYMREINLYIKGKKLNKLLLLVVNSDKVLSQEYSQEKVDGLFRKMVLEQEIDGESIDVISFEEGIDKVNYELIFEVNDGSWGNTFSMDYYSNKIEANVIPLYSIVVVNYIKYVITQYNRITKYYTLRECLNYHQKVIVKREEIKSVLR